MARAAAITWGQYGDCVSANAVLFDMDGVLTLNSGFHAEAWQLFAKTRLGISFDINDTRIHGGRNADILAALTGKQPSAAAVQACEDEKERNYRALATGRLGPVPGLHLYLNRLAASSVPVALVTSAGGANVDFVLGELGLASRFPVTITVDDVANGKPQPEPYLKAAAALRTEPERCLVHEDSPAGVRSAIAAGCQVVALTTTVEQVSLAAVGATASVPDFDAWLALAGFGAIAK